MVVMNGVLRGRWSAPQTTELLSELSCWLLGVGSKNSRFWITDWPERYQEIGNKGSLDWGSLRCLLSASRMILMIKMIMIIQISVSDLLK